MKMSKDQKLTDEEIYYSLLAMMAEVEETDNVDLTGATNLPLALKRLEVGIKYRMLDLEATRRERGYWKDQAENNGKKK